MSQYMTWRDVASAPLFWLAVVIAFIGAVLEAMGEEIHAYALAIGDGLDRWTGRGKHGPDGEGSQQ